MTRINISHILKTAALSLAVAALSPILSSCSQEIVEIAEPVSSAQLTEGEPFLISGSLDIPEMLETQTRALGETPASGLILTVLEFSLGTNATNSFLTNIYRAEIKGATNTLQPVTFTVKLTATNEPRILHFMLAKNYVTCEYGSEATVIPSISTTDEAYWYRLEFPNGYMDADGSGKLADDVVTAMTNIPMIRNFAKINVQSKAANFELYGFELLNIPSSATIAPFNVAATQVPTLLGSDKQMLTYSQVMAQNPGYSGIMPGNVTFSNNEATVRGMNNFQHTNKTANVLWSKSARYFFEHPFNRLNYSYLIVQGRYYGSGVANANDRIDYYKIDLGNTNPDTGLFEYYDLLRNYNFNVVINNVLAPGASTPAEAILLPPSNNISASVETSSMRNVSDGKNMLFVNETNYIFTTTEPVYFRYHYMEDITGGRTPNNDAAKISGLEPGAVIASVGTPTTYTDEQGTVWVQYEITPKTPTNIIQTQTFTVYDGLGLGREINLTLRNPWLYGTNPAASVWEGAFDQPTQKLGDVTYRQGIVGTEAGSEFTVYFYLPDGLTEGMFPLQFQLEANPQDMENNPIGTLVVNTGSSLFDPDVTSISYIKTVSWREYNFMYKGDGSNEVNTNTNNRNRDHIVRCRFRTINSNTGTTTIRIYNPYFKTATSDYEIVTFTRQ